MSKRRSSRISSGLKRIKSTRVRALLSLGMVFGLGAVGTLAYWTDSATLTGGTFTAGTLDIKLKSGATAAVDNNPAGFATDFTVGNMQPGDSKSAVVSVLNSGSLGFLYSATGTVTGTGLGPFLRFTVYPGGAVSGNSCTGTSVFGPAALTTNTPIFANRAIAAAGNETFCVVATFPTGGGPTDGQGLNATATFNFAAKQVGAP
ncbi:MAG: TasA family protein [Aeromicrobium sp.]